MRFDELNVGDCFCLGENHIFRKVRPRSDLCNALVLASSLYTNIVIFENSESVKRVDYAIAIRTDDECLLYAPNGLIISRVPL